MTLIFFVILKYNFKWVFYVFEFMVGCELKKFNETKIIILGVSK